MPIRFRTAWISNTSFMCHVSEDVQFVIMPVIGDSPVLEGFRIYNLRTGELEEQDFVDLTSAKKHVESLVNA